MSIRIQVANIRNAMDDVHAYQQQYLKTLRTVPGEPDLLRVLDELRHEVAKSVDGKDVGSILARERIASVAYIGLLELLEEGLLQAVKESRK